MKVLTIRQPWTWAIVHGGKRIENRSWWTSHRGLLLIHAGSTVDRQAPPHLVGAAGDRPDLGCVVATAELVDICDAALAGSRRRCECGGWAEFDVYHWRLANVRPLHRPVRSRGFQGLWTASPAVELQVQADFDHECAPASGRANCDYCGQPRPAAVS